MKFLAPSHLWFLAAVGALAVLYLVTQRRRRRYAVRFTNLALLDKVAPKRPGWRRHLPALAFLCMLGSLVVAFARPTRNVSVPQERATIVVAVDVSLSMAATDVTPSRLEAAKDAAAAFVDALPARFNVGLVAFSGVAQVAVTPTTDHAEVKDAIANLQLGPSTAIGEAIFAALQSIKSLPPAADKKPVPARVVLMSDGETTAGRPNDEASAAAAQAGVPVSTIAYGTDHGAVVTQGRRVSVPVNGDALKAIASTTKGKFFQASSGDELRSVYQDIGSSVGHKVQRREVTSWWVGLALAFGVASAGFSLAWFSRLP